MRHKKSRKFKVSRLFKIYSFHKMSVLTESWQTTELVACHDTWLVLIHSKYSNTMPSFKPNFHTCVSKMHNNARCLTMYDHQWSQTIPAFATKACELATKSHMLNFCEGLRGLCRDMLWLWSIKTNNTGQKKIFCPPKKKSKAENKKYNDDFRKVVIFN